jgi:hypothetical protein
MIETEQMVIGRCPFVNQRVENEDSQTALRSITEYALGLGHKIRGYYPGIIAARTECRHFESPQPKPPSLRR